MSTLVEVLEGKSRAVHAVAKGASVFDAVDKMCKLRVGALLVGDANRPEGILSERDVLTRVMLEGRDPRATLVGDAMTTSLVCVALDVAPEEAMRIMTEQRCRHLPVVTDGQVVGIVSIGDLVRWVSRHQEYEIQWLSDYLVGRYPG